MNSYSYKTSANFISELQFDYIETYSFQRGEEFIANQQKDINEYIRLIDSQKKRNLSKGAEAVLAALLKNRQPFLLESTGKFHTSSEKTHKFERNAPQVEFIINTLNMEAIDIPNWVCSPIYKDALVFYSNNGTIVSTLNICFSCEHMATTMFNEISADDKTYKLLKQFFIELGHKIENY